jgi:hypothetical protein
VSKLSCGPKISAGAKSRRVNDFGIGDPNQDSTRTVREHLTQTTIQFEPFVDADAVAEFLAVKRKTILDWARSNAIPAHPYGRGKRVVWRFRISEIASHNRRTHSTMAQGSPEIARLGNE